MITPVLVTGDCHVRTAVNKSLGTQCIKVSTQEDFFAYCQKKKETPDVVIIDVHCKGINPLFLMSWLKNLYPDCLVIGLYKPEGMSLSMQRLSPRLFCLSYTDARVTDHLATVIRQHSSTPDALVSEHDVSRDKEFLRAHLIGSSPAMKSIREHILLFAPQTHAPIHISGETGTGKEVCADMLHYFSGLRGRNVRVNCSSLSGSLVETTLFGKVQGAYTDARQDSEGLIAEAADGTLFLDEMQELSLNTQARLLRTQENHTYTKVGTTKEQVSHFRLISASCFSLAELKAEGRLRKDFYYRLNYLNIHIPPLRERREDIPELCRHHLEHVGELRRISSQDMELLMSLEWEGNVRELFSVLERARIFSSGLEMLDISKEALGEASWA